MNFQWILFGIPILTVLAIYIANVRRKERKNLKKFKSAVNDGLTEPPSLHPVFKPDLCIGCGACIPACPERAIGIMNGKGALVAPTKCIGHGACYIACPVDGIELVFGTEKRGLDIPHVNPNYETNIKNIFIAGELGGMGLIRKSAQQGSEAIKEIEKRKNNKTKLDVVIVGAGPAGIAATLGAKEKNLRYITIEQEDSLGGAVYHYPRNKLTMTAPVTLPIIGQLSIFDIQKENLLNIWKDIYDRAAITINFNERMEEIKPSENGFIVKTTKAEYDTSCVLLAIGRRGTPRKLEVPGESSPKVVYRLIDTEQYRNQHVLVVGGGDSAVEAALSLSDEIGTTVTLSYRNEAFGRIKQKNKENLEKATAENKLKVLLSSNVLEIKEKTVLIEQNGQTQEIANDAVIICAGGILPTPFLKNLGILVETHHGKTKHNT